MKRYWNKKPASVILAGLMFLCLAVSGCAPANDGADQGTSAAVSDSTSKPSAEAQNQDGQNDLDSSSEGGESQGSSSSSADASPVRLTADYKNEDIDASWEETSSCMIILTGNSAQIDGNGAVFDGSTLTIRKAGTYVITGTLDDGQIMVNSDKDSVIRIVLNGVSVKNTASAPLYIKQADKTVLILADGTENQFTDAETYLYEDETQDEPDAAIFSKDDLSITGNGSLTVSANYNNGITGKDDLIITGGTITVTAVHDAVRGKDSVTVKDCTLTLSAGGDGLKSNNDTDAEKGCILIENGSFTITAGNDGIQAETALEIDGGNFIITTAGGFLSSADEQESQKGIKSGTSLIVREGTFTVDSADDAFHTNGALLIEGGTITISAGDDGMHADSTLTVDGGDILINSCYEGLEGSNVVINSGTIRLTASDDGINAAGGSDTNAAGGRPGLDHFSASENYSITVNGGYLVVNASGDGLDSNGNLSVNGGTVLVNGPTSGGDGALDYDGTCEITGGILIAAGSAAMAQAPGTSSAQCSLMITFSEIQQAGTCFHIADSSGTPLISFAPEIDYQNIVISIPEFTVDSVYTLMSGGTAADSDANTLSLGGAVSGEKTLADITLTGTVTSVNDSGEAVSGGMSDFGRGPGGLGGKGGNTGNGQGGRGGDALPNGRPDF